MNIKLPTLSALVLSSATVVLTLPSIFYIAITTNSVDYHTIIHATKICVPAVLIAGFLGYRIGILLEVGRIRAIKLEKIREQEILKAKQKQKMQKNIKTKETISQENAPNEE